MVDGWVGCEMERKAAAVIAVRLPMIGMQKPLQVWQIL